MDRRERADARVILGPGFEPTPRGPLKAKDGRWALPGREGEGARRREVARTATTVSRVRELRLARGWRQTDLSARAGCSPQRIVTAEQGQLLRLSMDTLLRISLALDCGPADLFPVLGGRHRVAREQTAAMARAEREQAKKNDSTA